ncbi:MAG: hydroxyisourate hydrolase [Paracoccaceae bacterium]
MAGYVTTHVLDTALGLPARGITVELFKVNSDTSVLINSAITNSDGRLDSPILSKKNFVLGHYELLFHVKKYFEAESLLSESKIFFDIIPVRCCIKSATHYHIPLLLSPFGYSTYRGS